MLLNVKLKLIVRLMLKPVLNLGTMESTAILINIKDSTMDTLMVKGTLCLPTPDILPLRTLDILLLLTPDILPLFSRIQQWIHLWSKVPCVCLLQISYHFVLWTSYHFLLRLSYYFLLQISYHFVLWTSYHFLLQISHHCFQDRKISYHFLLQISYHCFQD